jgi:hypothetical protein
MNKPNFIFKIFLFVLALSATSAFAQTDNKQAQADPCYEVVLQLLMASNAAGGKSSLPPALSNTVKKLKTLYNFSDYRLTTTFLQRTSNTVEYKSLLTEFNQITDKNYPAFSEWSLRGLRNIPNAQGRNVLQFDMFKFGMRIPIVRSGASEGGNAQSSVVYDSTGVTTTRFAVNENEPTVVGSLTTSKPDELVFLILTVKPAE